MWRQGVGYLAVLYKLRLSLLVVFSAMFGYVFAAPPRSAEAYLYFLGFLLGSFLITAAASAFNQVLEVSYDRLMQRTRHRPLPSGRLSTREGCYWAFSPGLLGFLCIFIFTNFLTLCLSFFAFFTYVCVYTLAKRRGALAVLWGAIPGAMPPLLGYVGQTGYVSYEALLMFSVQFIWQFPHFWSIAWLLDEDYQRAGIRLLPGDKNTRTALCIATYTLFLIPLGFLPSYYGITGMTSGLIAVLLGGALLMCAAQLTKNRTQKAAYRLKFASFLYLPTVQMAYLLDKVHG